MVDNGWLGQKSQQGFYKKIEKGVIHSIDLETLEYKPQNKKRYTGIRLAKENTQVGDKIKALVNSDDIAGQFIWEITTKAILYSANRLGEISDDIVNIDRAMRWGFGWSLGPFEVWDAIGVRASVERMKADNKDVPAWVSIMLDNGNDTFYKRLEGFNCYWDINKQDYLPITVSKKELRFSNFKYNGSLIEDHWSASIIDLGDGVAGVNFHSVLQGDLNPIDGSILQTLYKAINRIKVPL
jgi:3-hydroxyacyl-CoA dehydrogenase